MKGQTKPQQAMLDALEGLVAEPDTFRPAIILHGAGQYATARALARRGLVQFFPIGRVEPTPAMYAEKEASNESSSHTGQ